MTYTLELRSITKRYDTFTAVDSLSFRIPKGCVYGLLGPNGAGKTTSIRMMIGITLPDSGEVWMFGEPFKAAHLDRVGYLPEERGLYKRMKIGELLSFFAQLKGVSRVEAEKRAAHWLERLELQQWAKSKAEELSKGMQQKVQVLASIVHSPEFVILDEPFSGLDPVTQEVMEQVIRDLKENKQTVIFSTHVMEHADRLCDRIVLIAHGQKLFEGTISEAKRTIPRRVLIETASDVSPLRAVPGVTNLARVGDDGNWDVTLAEGANADEILRACFRQGIELRSFDRRDPGLRDVFIKLVSKGDAGEESA